MRCEEGSYDGGLEEHEGRWRGFGKEESVTEDSQPPNSFLEFRHVAGVPMDSQLVQSLPQFHAPKIVINPANYLLYFWHPVARFLIGF